VKINTIIQKNCTKIQNVINEVRDVSLYCIPTVRTWARKWQWRSNLEYPCVKVTRGV